MAFGQGTLETLGMNSAFWHGKRVLVTGHTGFKGGWLALWLTEMGAEVCGCALEPPTEPSFFSLTYLGSRLSEHRIQDIRDSDGLTRIMTQFQPEIVFHLAAQPLVRDSYRTPVVTYEVNIMGTVHLLEAVRQSRTVRAVVVITSDKCYENQEWVWPYRETDPIGGHDPYASSKGCAEIVTAAYRRAFLADSGVQIASARTGNVIGGGDWAHDRLIPDFLRALDAGRPLPIRSPDAIRPWQHVLEPLRGYLMLARHLCESDGDFAEGWNFGPNEIDARSVRWIVEYLCERVPDAHWYHDGSPHPHEDHFLMLDSGKARARLGWRPRWNLATALERTLEWHTACRRGEDMCQFSLRQITAYASMEFRA